MKVMKHEERYRKEDREKWTGIIFLFMIFTICMLVVFVRYSDNIHDKVLERETEQTKQISDYLTKIIHAEMEHCVEILDTSEIAIQFSGDQVTQNTLDVLRKIKEETEFNSIGIVSPDGKSVNETGTQGEFKDTDFMEKIQEDGYYISNTLSDGEQEVGQILIAVPLYEGEEIVGAVWGQYPVTAIAEKIDLTGESERYFQIIDDEGNYISRSGNKNSFAENMLLWKELERYQLSEGATIEGIKKRVEQHKSGMFYFKYQGEGRVVTYEPLEINNWYVFSVLVEDSMNIYVNEVKRLSMNLLLCFAVFILSICGAIGVGIYRGNQMIKKQNKQLQIKTQLFRMTLHQTKDIPFEIELKERILKIYCQNGSKEQEYEIIRDFSPDMILKSGKIRKTDVEKYRRLYDAVIQKKEVEPFVMEININDVWEWMRVHLLMIDQNSMIGFLEDYNEQMEQSKKLEEMSQKTKYDALTNVYNRDAFVQEISVFLEESKKENRQNGALLLLDLDNFKEINDTLGHVVGDQVLQEVAFSLKSAVRKSDLVGRLGGDEFVVLLKDMEDLSSIRTCAEEINKVLTKTYEKNGSAVTVSVSIGIAIAEKGMTFQELYEKADVVLYEVKNEQRNGYRIAEKEER